jgi:hypothetical protein
MSLASHLFRVMGGAPAPAPAPAPAFPSPNTFAPTLSLSHGTDDHGSSAAGHESGHGSGHEGPVSIFGIITTLDSNVGTYAFIGFLIGLVVLEYFIEKLEKIAEAKGLASLFQKLQKELMMMGVISFGVFIYQTAAHPAEGNVLLEAMDMTHIIVLFMALAFIVQAFFLVMYATFAGMRYLTIMRTSSETLVDEYRALEHNPRLSWWFHYGSSMIPGTCPLRTNIETRIIERLFVRQHQLPPEFNFAQYISMLFEVCFCPIMPKHNNVFHYCLAHCFRDVDADCDVSLDDD